MQGFERPLGQRGLPHGCSTRLLSRSVKVRSTDGFRMSGSPHIPVLLVVDLRVDTCSAFRWVYIRGSVDSVKIVKVMD